jgi:hypothetical protein
LLDCLHPHRRKPPPIHAEDFSSSARTRAQSRGRSVPHSAALPPFDESDLF